MHLTTATREHSQKIMDPSPWPGGALQAGEGTSDLYIGQSASEVEGVLGKPEKIRKFGSEYFYQYFSLGVDVEFGKRHNRSKRLFFRSRR
jgi:hypothetical protein